MKDTILFSPQFNRLSIGFEQELIKEKKRIKNKLSMIKEFLSYMEQRQIQTIAGIEQHHLDNYFIYLEQERMNSQTGGGLEQGTILGHRNTISSFLKYLKSEQVKTNLALKPMKRKKGKKKLPRVLTKQEIQNIYSVTDDSIYGYRDRAMLSVHYALSMRSIEARRLELSDLQLNSNKIFIQKSKNGSERYAVLTPVSKRHIEDYLDYSRTEYLSDDSTHQAFFISQRGNPVSEETLSFRLNVLWKRVVEKYGKQRYTRIGLHTLRHSLATHLYLYSKIDLKRISKILGHKRPDSTQIYVHLANELKYYQNQ